MLLSKGVLTRPWCLLEIHTAARLKKPTVLLELRGGCEPFSFEEAFALLEDLEDRLPPLNPVAIGELHAPLQREGSLCGGAGSLRGEARPLVELQETVRQVLEAGRAGMVHLTINETANQLESELIRLAEAMARASGRTLTWSGGRTRWNGKARGERQRSGELPRSRSRSWMGGALMQRVTGDGSWMHKVTGDGSRALNGSMAYIICEDDARSEAHRLQEGMNHTLAQPCDLEVPGRSVKAIQVCLERLGRSKYVLLLQTRSVLSQPWALLAAYHAAVLRIPIVCVVLHGRSYEESYDFQGAVEHLRHLSERLAPDDLALISAVLSRSSPPRGVEAMRATLAMVIPHTISVSYCPAGDATELSATACDIWDKYCLLKRTRWVPSKLNRMTSKLNSSKLASWVAHNAGYGGWTQSQVKNPA